MMTIIIIMNLAGIDLNLLLVFDAIMTERHVTRAGDKISMSQPAMSNALKRLRGRLKDELFVRGPDGMQPTARAFELAVPIRDVLQTLEVTLEPNTFDPLSAKRLFSIGTNDYCVSTIVPKLVERLEKEAPGINIKLRSSVGETLNLLNTQTIDFGISAIGAIPEQYGSKTLIEDTYILLMRKGHPLATRDVSIDEFTKARHIVISPKGDPSGFVDIELEKQGLSRQVAITINNFSSAPAILTSSDLVLTAPQRIAEAFAPHYSLITKSMPFLAEFKSPKEFASIKLIWHKKLANHPAHQWFKQTIIDVSQKL